MRTMKLQMMLAGVMLGVMVGAAQAASFTAYREVYPNDFPVDATQGEIALAQGWIGEQHGSIPVGAGDGQISTSSGFGEPTPINSNPMGPIDDTGFFFWSPAARAGVYIYTEEFQINSSLLTEVKWDSRNNTFWTENPANEDEASLVTDSDMHVAFRLAGESDNAGNVWYISQQGVPHTLGTSTWQSQSFDLSGALFNRFDVVNPGEPAGALPRFSGDLADIGLTLPTGNITAFGLWIEKNQPAAGQGQAQVRIDNFALEAVPTPTTAAAGLVLLGLATFRRRR